MNLHIERGLKAFAEAHFAAQNPAITWGVFSGSTEDKLEPRQPNVILSMRDHLKHECDELWIGVARVIVFSSRPNASLEDHAQAILDCGHRPGNLFDEANVSLLDTHLRAQSSFGTTGFWVVDSVNLDNDDHWIEELRVKIRLAEI